MTEEHRPEFMLGVISGKIDLVLSQIATDRHNTDNRFLKIEERQDTSEGDIASLRRDKAWVLGMAAAISSVGAALGVLLEMGK